MILKKLWAGLLAACFVAVSANAQDAEITMDPDASRIDDIPSFEIPPDRASSVRSNYQASLYRWQFARDQAAFKDLGGCEHPDAINTDDYVEYCIGVETSAAQNATIIHREFAPFIVQLAWSDLAVEKFKLAEQLPNWTPWERQHLCGGSLVARDWVLTAAHCLLTLDKEDYTVRLDVSDLSDSSSVSVPVIDMIIHEDYDKGTNFNDIALLRIDMQGVALNLQAPPTSTYEMQTGGRWRGPLHGATLLDERTLLIELAGNKIELLDVKDARRRALSRFPTDQTIDKYKAGAGYLAIQSGREIYLYSGGWTRPRQLTHGADILDFDYDPKSRQLAVLDKNTAVTTYNRRLRKRDTSTVRADRTRIRLMGEDHVRVSDQYGQTAMWRVGRSAPERQLDEWLYSAVGNSFADFPGQPEISSGERSNGAEFHRFFFFEDERTMEFKEGIITLTGDGRTREMKTDMFPPKLALHPKGNYLVAFGQKPNDTVGMGEVFDVRGGVVAWRFETDAGFLDSNVTFFDDGNRFALWDGMGRTQTHEFWQGGAVKTLPHSVPITRARLKEDRYSVVMSDSATAEVTDLMKGEVTARVQHGLDMLGMDLVENRLMTWSKDGRIRIWDASSGMLQLDYRIRPGEDLSSTDPQGVPDQPMVTLVNLSDVLPQTETIYGVNLFGWGKTQKSATAPPSTQLRMIGMSPKSWDECIELSTASNPEAIRDPKAFCASVPGRKSCSGDSGGPVIYHGALVGIISRGSGVCKTDERTSTYTTVASFKDWIKDTVCPTQRVGQQVNGVDTYPTFCPGE